MKVKAALIDFDYTLTTKDTLDLLARHLGVEDETAKLDRLFWEGKLPGLQGLVRRINLLKGLSRVEISEILESEDVFRDGVFDLFDYFKKHGIVTVIASGNILPVLENAKNTLGADYVVCSKPTLVNNAVDSISEQDYSGDDFKIRDSKAILQKLGISSDYVIAIGDSPADKSLFEFANISFAVEPKNGVEKFATYTVGENLAEIVEILDNIHD